MDEADCDMLMRMAAFGHVRRPGEILDHLRSLAALELKKCAKAALAKVGSAWPQHDFITMNNCGGADRQDSLVKGFTLSI
jgi:hypothetical protein